MRLVLSLLFLLSAAMVRAEALPPLRALDGIPAPWLEIAIDKKGSWDETWTANHQEQAWRQSLAQNAELSPVAERILLLRSIRLRENMIELFPDEHDKHAEAYLAIAAAYHKLGDRLRAAHAYKKIADDFPDQDVLVANACIGILECSDPFDALPDAQAWVKFASQAIDNMQKAGRLTSNSPAVELSRQRTWRLLLHEGRYEAGYRFLAQQNMAGDEEQWESEKVSLLLAAGHLLQAAEALETGVHTNLAEAAKLRKDVRRGVVGDTGKHAALDLTMRLDALWAKERAGEPVLGDPALAQESLSLSADSDAMCDFSETHRMLCRVAIDRLLRDLRSDELLPLRETQELEGGPLASELSDAVEEREWLWLFERYPWSQTVNARLVDYAENCLWQGRWGEASRAFLSTVEHSNDPVLTAQAHLGLWMAMGAQADAPDDFAALMAAVSDDVLLPWRNEVKPAAEVKAAILNSVPRGLGAISTLSGLRRAKLRLPARLVNAEPFTLGGYPAPRALGAWALRRIEQSGKDLFVAGPQHMACYDAETLELRWVQSGNPAIDLKAGGSADLNNVVGPRWPQAAWRPVVWGSTRSRAITEISRRGKDGNTRTAQAVYGMMFYNLRAGTFYDIAAFDAQSGAVLWRTGTQTDWNGWEPISDPVASEGRVYVVARGAAVGPYHSLSLVCIDGSTGVTLWKSRLGYASTDGERQELARRGNAVTLHQGALYVSTNLGLLARCNPRDGIVEWVYGYAGAVQTGRLREQFRREGTSPFVVGDFLLVAPRDHSGIMALDRRTGDLLWEELLVPSESMLGVAGSTIVVRSGDRLAGLDLASGKEIWAQAALASNGARAHLSGTDLFVLSRNSLMRIAALTGETRETLELSVRTGVEHLLLPDGALVEVSGESTQAPSPGAEKVHPEPQSPLAADWTMASQNPLLVSSSPAQSGAAQFGILSGRTFQCVKTQPRCELAWQTLLKDGADSVGFHGNLVLVARGQVLTALGVADGALRWSLRLPFEAHVVGGNDKVLFAGEQSKEAKVASINPADGSLHWIRWFGKEVRFDQAPLAWVSLQRSPAESPALILYWRAGFSGKAGWQPTCMFVDAMTGDIQEDRQFLLGETSWPSHLIFGGGSRTYVNHSPFLYSRPSLAGFRGDAIAWVGNGSKARFYFEGQGLTPPLSWERPVDEATIGRYAGALGFHAGDSGVYLKQLHELFYYDAASKKEGLFALPQDNARREGEVLDLREQGNRLMVLSAEAPRPPKSDPRNCTHGGLTDDRGNGDVTIHWGGPNPQIHNGVRGLAEAGTCAVTTMLDGNTKEHYVPQTFTISGMASLGWTRYDVFFYGGSGDGTIGSDTQSFKGCDFKNQLHRTTLIRGINYLKFSGVSGDSFSFSGAQANFSGIQIVDASAGDAPGRKAGSIGINWAGGGVGLGPNDRVGAEVEAGYWYNIGIKHELSGGFQAPLVYVDTFNRSNGSLIVTQPLPIVPREQGRSGHDFQAAILDDAVVVTDAKTVYVLRNQ